MNYIMNYILEPVLKHSAKGTEWSKHKYIAKKKNKAGKTIYVYTTKGGSIADKLGITALKASNENTKENQKLSDDLGRNKKMLEAAKSSKTYTNEKDIQNAQKAVDETQAKLDYNNLTYRYINETLGQTPIAKVAKAKIQFENALVNYTQALKREIKRRGLKK